MFRKFIVLLLFLFFLVSNGYPQVLINGKVIRVYDGDTIAAQYMGEETKIRLNGIDAPDMRQLSGKEGQIYLYDLIS